MESDIKVTVEAQKPEEHVPEANALEKLNGLFYRIGNITRRSQIPHAEKPTQRPLHLRNKRAELYRQAKNSPTEVKKNIIVEARARDEIAAQYLSQGEVKVDIPGIGEQSARYTMIEPPSSRKSIETGAKPPVVLIPGISNDIDCVGWLAQELPYQGRSVVVIGFPESHMGSVNEQFVEAVEKSSDYGPHVDFYKNAIKGLMGKEGDMELWGFSTGSPITAQILTDPEFQNRVTDAVFLSPASCADQTSSQLNLGIIRESQKLLQKFKSLAKYTLTIGRNKDVAQQESDQKKLKKRTYKALLKKVRTACKWYPEAKVRQGGNIVVVSGEKDEITKSYQAKDQLGKNPQVKIIDLPEGHHSTPLINPEKVLPQVFRAQKGN